jgi:Ni/Co efflux regulator RcnB
MPLIIVTTSGKRIDLKGEAKDIKRWRPGRFIEAEEMNGIKIALNFDSIAFVSCVTDEFYAAQMAAMQKRGEEAQKKNPNPGREPKLVVPRAS